jgi:lanosterol synthase
MHIEPSYDVAIVGGGPVGCATALAFARRGARALLLEASPQACDRLAGEWLHPPAAEILADLQGHSEVPWPTGEGFVVYPEDGSDTVVLPYREGSRGLSLEHASLVEGMRARCRDERSIDFREGARALGIEGQRMRVQTAGRAEREVAADLIVGAAGRRSLVHKALGLEPSNSPCSRMAGLLLDDVELPHEGFGHVILGGPGPVLAYRIDDRYVRLCLDVPLSLRVNAEPAAVLWDAFAPVMPGRMRQAFREALMGGELRWAANQIRPRSTFGRPGLALVGDATGHHHPLTAVGMTLGFQDAVTLAESADVHSYRAERMRSTRVPEMLAVALYEVFADTSDEVVAIRRAVYRMWRESALERSRTMGYLAGQDADPLRFGSSFVKAIALASAALVGRGWHGGGGHPQHAWRVGREMASRVGWLLSGALRSASAEPYREARSADEEYGDALRASGAKAEIFQHPAASQPDERSQREALVASSLERAARALVAEQRDDGSWEGEVVWCPMLAAQYVIACHLTGTPIDESRRRRLLLHFETTTLSDGTWGLHQHSEPYLFVTTLVYVAARLLGEPSDAPLLAAARRMFVAEGGVKAIPTWGKFWLALLGLYEWSGVNPVLPEAWLLPESLPLHPSRYYCHTRLIYLGMASLYGERLTSDDALVEQLRHELYPAGYRAAEIATAHGELREADLFTPPSMPLRAIYAASRQVDRAHPHATRVRVRAMMREHIRFELDSSDDTCISPVSGLLNILALWHNDPSDPYLERAIARFDGWMWEDDIEGTRVTGARSATWDSSFALQALSAAAPHVDVTAALERGDAFLGSQQIREPQQPAELYPHHYRVDPRGGFCFAGVWHGWPVSDCTAEAMCARLESPVARPDDDAIRAAAEFVLRCQNDDGGFGSYEPRKTGVSLEWMNPAEMFGDSMTEKSYVECTASCIVAVARYRHQLQVGDPLRRAIDEAVGRALHRLRLAQRPDGAWPGAWGVCFSYGTMFGIRGLLAAGASPQDPAVRKACRFLKRHQRADGSWGEAPAIRLDQGWQQADRGQVVQTAWALSALLEAQDPDFGRIEAAAAFIARRQQEDGRWPREQMAGVFFHTALLDYRLYKSYFPLWALALYETRRLARLPLVERRSPARDSQPEREPLRA